jgi:hypothetical protein
MDCYIYISYISSQNIDLLEFTRKFSNNNKLHGITGVLLYHCGNVIQLFEGPIDQTKQLLFNIKKDPLHTRFKVLLHENITTRNFPEWNMGFVTEHSEFYNKFLFNSEFINPKVNLLFNTFQKIIREN